MIPAISSAVPGRLNAVGLLSPSPGFASCAFLNSGVKIDPGAIALTLIFLPPTSFAADLVRPITPCLLATYAPLPAKPVELSAPNPKFTGKTTYPLALESKIR